MTELRASLEKLKESIEKEVVARAQRDRVFEHAQALTRRLVYVSFGIAGAPWIYIVLHLAKVVR